MANPHGYSQTGIDLLNAELAKRGIGPAAASGAIAGIMGESGANLDPTSFNSKDPGGGSGGIGQWNRGRLIGPNGMLAFAKNAGVDVNPNSPLDAKKVPLATQAQYLGHELDTTYAGVTKQLQTAANPQDALNIWVKSYENPADPGAAISTAEPISGSGGQGHRERARSRQDTQQPTRLRSPSGARWRLCGSCRPLDSLDSRSRGLAGPAGERLGAAVGGRGKGGGAGGGDASRPAAADAAPHAAHGAGGGRPDDDGAGRAERVWGNGSPGATSPSRAL